jgi:dethiobiotin synthetase
VTVAVPVVTGTGTGAGKTVVTAAVAALARDRDASCTVIKPAQTGVDDDGLTLADVARTLHAPVLVVTASGLGTLNSTALTLAAMAHRGLELAGVVIGSWPNEPDMASRSNVRDLEMLAARPLLGAVPEGAGTLSSSAFLDVARASLGPQLGGSFDARAFRAGWEV